MEVAVIMVLVLTFQASSFYHDPWRHFCYPINSAIFPVNIIHFIVILLNRQWNVLVLGISFISDRSCNGYFACSSMSGNTSIASGSCSDHKSCKEVSDFTSLVRKAAMVSMPVLLFQEILLLSKGAVTTTILAAISLGQCMLGT